MLGRGRSVLQPKSHRVKRPSEKRLGCAIGVENKKLNGDACFRVEAFTSSCSWQDLFESKVVPTGIWLSGMDGDEWMTCNASVEMRCVHGFSIVLSVTLCSAFASSLRRERG